LQELEERDDIEDINGERAIEFGAGWGRLRYYLIRDRFGSVDLIDINNVMLD
jgi:ubiquinone/menaquinone biosynthesis C-methylase UbiE